MIIDPDLRILSKNKFTQRVAAPVDPTTATGVIVSPNPAIGQLQIKLPGTATGNVLVQLINSLGQVVYSKPIAANTTQVDISTYNFAAGIYWLRLADGKDFNLLRKVLVVRR